MDPFSAFPETLPAPGGTRSGSATAPPRVYTLDRSRFAVRGDAPPALRDRVETRIDEADDESVGGFTVIRAPSSAAEPIPTDRLAPVYVLGGGGAPFIPTGRIGIRFAEGVSARDREAELRGLGYRIVEIPAYAPHFAWLESESGHAAALTALPRLAALPGVEHVEPQMVTPRALR